MSKAQGRVIGLRPILPSKPAQNEREAPSVENDETANDIIAEAQQQKEEANTILRQAREESDRLIKETEENIQSLKDQWEQEKQHLIEEVKKQAYQEGFASGEREAFAEYEGLIQKAHSVIDQANEDYQARVNDSEETILHLSMKSASKIMNQTLTNDPATFLPIVQSVLEEANNADQVSVYVHPDQFEQVLEQREELQLILDHQAELSIYPKTNLQSYQCYMESSYGRVDVSIDSQLTELRQKLFRLLEEAK